MIQQKQAGPQERPQEGRREGRREGPQERPQEGHREGPQEGRREGPREAPPLQSSVEGISNGRFGESCEGFCAYVVCVANFKVT
jgi:flagellar biosynthesis/type III secretory pathway protein FliH